MDNIEYLTKKGESLKKNKNLNSLPLFFTEKELDELSKKAIAIVGTNGKTSTANQIFQYFVKADISVCRFTSPHLVQVNERIQTNSGLIKDKELIRYLDEVRKFEKREGLVLGYFEALFLISCKYFLDMELDIFIVEAGIGGRLDTTSIINSENVVLTNVGYDHTEILGESLEEILIEKINISSRVKNFFSGDLSTELEFGDLIRKELDLSLNEGSSRFGGYFISYVIEQDNINMDLEFDFRDHPINIDFDFLDYNDLLALLVFGTLVIQRELESKIGAYPYSHYDDSPTSPEAVRDHMHDVGHESGRYEIIHSNEKTFKIIDGAHNTFAIYALNMLLNKQFLPEDFPKVECFFGMKTGKDYKGILYEFVEPVVERSYGFSLIEDHTFRDQMNPEIIAEYLTELGVKYKYASLEDFHSYNEPCILLGSLYLVGEYKKEYQ